MTVELAGRPVPALAVVTLDIWLAQQLGPDAVAAVRGGDVPEVFRRRVPGFGAVAQVDERAVIRSVEEARWVDDEGVTRVRLHLVRDDNGHLLHDAQVKIYADGGYAPALVCTAAQLAELSAWLDRFLPEWRTLPGAYGGTAVTIEHYSPEQVVAEIRRGDWLDVVEHRMSGEHPDDAEG